MDEFFGTTWRTAAFVAGSTAAIYITTLVGVRIAGRRTLAQFSAFDGVVTIALGSLVATTAVAPGVSYLEGSVALGTLLVLQLLLATGRQQSRRIRWLVDFKPEVLVADGSVESQKHLLSAQISSDELFSMLREKGVFDVSAPTLVLLEPNGNISVARSAEAARAAREHMG